MWPCATPPNPSTRSTAGPLRLRHRAIVCEEPLVLIRLIVGEARCRVEDHIGHGPARLLLSSAAAYYGNLTVNASVVEWLVMDLKENNDDAVRI
jgi:hypothetical protein